MSGALHGSFTIGDKVTVTSPCTPMARHSGRIVRRSPNGWRVTFDAWGMLITETMSARALELRN